MRLEFRPPLSKSVKAGDVKKPVFSGAANATSPFQALAKDTFQVRTGQVRFGAATEKEIEQSREKLVEAENLARMQALKKLAEADKLDEKTLKALARYLYFEDTYQTNDEPPVRLANRFRLLQLMEKHPNLWGAEALTMQMVEYGNSTQYPVSKYAGVVLSRIYPTLPKDAQLRIRSLMYGALLTESSSMIREHVPPLMAKFAPFEDASYLWFLIKKSAMTNSGNADYFRKILSHLFIREFGAPVFDTALDLYKEAKNGNPAPDIGDDDLKVIIREFPLFYLQKTDAELDRMPKEEVKRVVASLSDGLLTLQRNNQADSTSDFNTAKVISRLLKRMTPEDREAYIESLPPKIKDKTSSHKEFMMLILQHLYNDRYNLETLKRFVNKKNTTFYDRMFDRINDKAVETNSKPDLRGLLPEDEEDVIECREPEQAPLYSYYLDPSVPPQPGKPSMLSHFMKDPLAETSRLPFQSKFPPVASVQDRWDIEPLAMIANPTFFDRCEVLDKALDKGDKNEVYEALEAFTHDWLFQNSSQDYRYLMEMAQQPQAFKVFMEQMLHILKDEKRKVPLFFPSQTGSETPRKRITDISSQEMAMHLKQLVALLSAAVESYKGQSQDAIMDVSELCSVLAKREPTLRPMLLSTLFKAMQIESTSLEQRKKENSSSPNTPSMDKIRLKYLGASVLSILRMGYTDELIKNNSKQIQLALNSLEADTLLKQDGIFNYLKWNDVSSNPLEGRVDSDRVSTDSKKDFDLYMDLAIKSNNTEAMAGGVSRLYEHYLSVRDNSYADETFLMKYLKQPELVNFILEQPNDRLFEQFTEMQGWYKAFEAVPAMVAKAAEKNVPLRVSAIKAAIALMGNFARPDLNKILETGNAREKAVAQDILKRMDNSGFEWELFYPYPFPLPNTLMKRLEQVRNPEAVQKATGGKNTFRELPEDQAFDLDALLADAPEELAAKPNPFGKIEFKEAEAPIDFMDLDDNLPSTTNSSPQQPMSLIDQIQNAFDQMRSASAENRSRYVNQMVALADQFGAMAMNADSGVAFISPEKTELANQMARRLNETTNSGEKTGLLQALLILGGDADVVLPVMLRMIENSSTEDDHVIQALKIIGNLGAGGQEEVRERMYRESWINGKKKQAVDTMVQLRDGEGLIGAVENRNRMMFIEGIILKKIVQGLGEVAPGDEELETRTRTALLPMLNEDRHSEDVKLEMIKTLCLIANPDDMELMNTLADLLLGSNNREGKKELIQAITQGFFANTPEVQLVLRKFSRDTDTIVQRYAREAMALLGLANNSQ